MTLNRPVKRMPPLGLTLTTNDPEPNLSITIDSMVSQARQIERERVLLEVRRQIGRIETREQGHGYGLGSDRSADKAIQDARSIVDQLLAEAPP